MSDAFGELFEINEAGTTINIPVAGNFVKWVTASAGLAGPTDLVQVDAPNNQFVIGANGGGVYQAIVGVTMAGNVNSLKEAAIHVNGVRQQKIEANRQIGAAMDQGFFAPVGLGQLVPGDVVDFRFTADGNGDTVIIEHVVFMIHALIRDL